MLFCVIFENVKLDQYNELILFARLLSLEILIGKLKYNSIVMYK